MTITPRLSRMLHQTLGGEAGGDLVTWMGDMEGQRAELRELNEANFARFDARLAELRHEMQGGFAELRQEMQAGLAKTREDMLSGFAALRQEMAQLETRFERRLGDVIKWSFVFWVGAVGAIAMLAGVLP
jgi:hypothetical protein